ncbi:hypothetical protein [Aurantiacibacter rhizosphaerae]|uniref:DUF4105 domain-containing protein n=1 Tax=Aurantiacibacter rhizosphaerae TaxID=2691582 RepID=A0A844XF37_9SPHN|nr:hypothetical protein [Aurantiacibacter rhizosphaerae]MWV28359.1 hypothetical protein [Aurantiacibacter rhizosphaerae]
MIRKLYARILASMMALFAMLAVVSPAQADVQVHFHSFNGSVLWGRYPHTFVVFEGELDNGTRVSENYGFSARSSMEAISSGPAEHMILTETQGTIAETNRHFTVTVSDQQYRRLLATVLAWRDYPGKYYDLDDNNCIHFVAALARAAGLQADVPEEYVRRPKAWLNYVTRSNPQLGAREID